MIIEPIGWMGKIISSGHTTLRPFWNIKRKC